MCFLVIILNCLVNLMCIVVCILVMFGIVDLLCQEDEEAEADSCESGLSSNVAADLLRPSVTGLSVTSVSLSVYLSLHGL